MNYVIDERFTRTAAEGEGRTKTKQNHKKNNHTLSPKLQIIKNQNGPFLSVMYWGFKVLEVKCHHNQQKTLFDTEKQTFSTVKKIKIKILRTGLAFKEQGKHVKKEKAS